MNNLILKLTKKYHVKVVDDIPNTISIIASYTSELRDIAEEYNIVLTNTYINELTVQGIFTIS